MASTLSMSEAIEFRRSIIKFSQTVMSTENIGLDALIELSEIQPQIVEDLTEAQSFAASGIIPLACEEDENDEEDVYEYGDLDYVDTSTSTITPAKTTIPANNTKPWLEYKDCVWKQVFTEPLMVSEEGDIWNTKENKLVPQYFIDGYMRYSIDGNLKNAKRTCALVCRCYNIKGTCNDGRRWIIAFNDNDRRNLRPSNLRYIQQDIVDRPDPMDELVDDICQRLVQFNGDVNKVLPLYEYSSPTVTKQQIENIRTKREGRAISDKYFMFQNKQFFIRSHIQDQIEAKSSGLDIVGFFLSSGDKNLSINLIKDKLKAEQKVIDREWLLVIKIYIAEGKKKIKAAEIAEKINNDFGKDLPIDFINDLMNKEDAEIYDRLGV